MFQQKHVNMSVSCYILLFAGPCRLPLLLEQILSWIIFLHFASEWVHLCLCVSAPPRVVPVWALDSCWGLLSGLRLWIMSVVSGQPQMSHSEISECRKLCRWTELVGIAWISVIYWKGIRGALMTSRPFQLVPHPQRWWECQLASISQTSDGVSSCLIEGHPTYAFPLLQQGHFSFHFCPFSCWRVLNDPLPLWINAKCDLFSVDPCRSSCHIPAQTGTVTHKAYLIHPYSL